MPGFEQDVLVAGAGPAGCTAALAAARNGARVMLVERYGFLGGSATMPMPLLGFTTSEGEKLLGGLPVEIVERLRSLGGAIGPFTHPTLQSFIPTDGEILKCLLDDLMNEAGVKVLLHSAITGPILDGDVLKGVVVENKSGRREIASRIVVDATGDADVAAAAGAPFSLGREEDHLTQAATTQFQIDGVEIGEARAYLERHPAESVYPVTPGETARVFMGFPTLVEQARTQGYLASYPRSYVIFHTMIRESLVGVNTTKMVLNGVDAADLTRAEVAGRKQAMEITKFLRDFVPGFANSRLLSFPTHLGVRETRRILGRYVLTGEDLLAGREFADGIARSRYPIDIHDPARTGPDLRLLKKFYTIPYASLLPRKIVHLIVAGRSLSATPEAMSSARVMGTCMAMGQAAGTAAALCARERISPESLDAGRLRRVLTEQGALV